MFIFVGDEVNVEREVVDVGMFVIEIEDVNFGVGYIMVEV